MVQEKKLTSYTFIDNGLVLLARSISEAISIFIFVVGVLVLVGWRFNLFTPTSSLSIFRPMGPNFAVGLLFLGASLWFLQEKRLKKLMRIAGQICAVSVFVVGATAFVEYIFGLNLFIDRLLFKDTVGSLAAYPGRLGFIVALIFMLFGLALLFLDVETKNHARPTEVFSISAGAVALLTIIGYINDLPSFYTGMAVYTATAIHLAISFFIFNFAVLFARPERGLVRVMMTNSFAGKMARRLLPATFIVPLVFSWLVEYAEHRGLYGEQFDLVLNTGMVIIVFSAFVLISAIFLEKQEEEKMKTDQEVSQMKTDFISFASHQLRTPLTVIKWNTEMLRNGDAGELTKEQKRHLTEIERGEKRMALLISSLLNISRLESGKIKVEPKSVDIVELISGVVAEISLFAKAKNCSIVFSKPQQPPPLISIDAALFKQILANLLSNATHYSKSEKCKIEVDFKEIKGYYQIDVIDEGVGIPADAQDKIFTKFFRAENAVKADTEGTGLGLYITKLIVERGGGKIWFESTEGKGSAFHFTIPKSGMKKVAGEKELAV